MLPHWQIWFAHFVCGADVGNLSKVLQAARTCSHMGGKKAQGSQSRKGGKGPNKCYAGHHWSFDENMHLVVSKPLAAVEEHIKVATVGFPERVGYKNANPQYDNAPTVDVTVRNQQYTLQIKCFSLKESIFPGVDLALDDLAPLQVLVVEKIKANWLKQFAGT